jgi:hypothetical protein
MRVELAICDFCGEEQRKDGPVFWELLHQEIIIVCPPDGINGGILSGTACCACRVKIHAAVMAIKKVAVEPAMNATGNFIPGTLADLMTP